jgi:hypothetical protein
MSNEVICEFCDKPFKSKQTLATHQKNTARCIKIQVDKLGKPLYEKANKETKPERSDNERNEDEKINIKYERSENERSENERSENERSENERSESESERSEKESSDSESSDNEATIKWSESESSDDELPIKQQVKGKVIPVKKIIKPFRQEVRQESPRENNKHLETKIDTLLDKFSNLEKDLDSKFKNVNSQIIKLHSLLEDCNPRVIIETIKRLQAMIEVKQENVEFIKEQFEELLENYYSIYKKIKYVKEDLEDMIQK